jgi:hypothetical protein
MTLLDVLMVAGAGAFLSLALGFVTVCPRTVGKWLRFQRDRPEILDELGPLPPGPIAPEKEDDIRRAA